MTGPGRLSLLTALAALLSALAAARAAATQHLVTPGESWDGLAARVEPGDEIILMPGRHRPATLADVWGTTDRPIRIRGADPANPSTIQADGFGIRLYRPRCVRISDLVITGAKISGIAVDAAPRKAPDLDTPGIAAPVLGHVDDGADAGPSGNVTLSRLTVSDTGPRGNRHAIVLRHLVEVRIDSCRVTGWGGSGLEIVGCTDVSVSQSRFTGTEAGSQASGVVVRGGSDRVRIEACRFDNAGDQGVCIGSASKLEDFPAPPAPDAAEGSLFEASRVWIERCVFYGGSCAVAFVDCERSSVHQSTIIRPRHAVISIRREQPDARFGSPRSCDFGSNLITWHVGDLESLVHLGPGAETGAVVLGENLWWGPDPAAGSLGDFLATAPLPQITDVDPRLDENLLPAVAAAEPFGAPAP